MNIRLSLWALKSTNENVIIIFLLSVLPSDGNIDDFFVSIFINIVFLL